MLIQRRDEPSLPASPIRCEPLALVPFRNGATLAEAEAIPSNPIRRMTAIRLHDLPLPLAELIEEVDHATPKQVVFLDSRPLLGQDEPHAVNFVDSATNPEVIPIALNANVLAPEIIAHELMHVWNEHVLNFEDNRRYFDPRNQGMTFLVNCIQSAVLDCKVLEELRKRGGFDLSRFHRDVLAAAFENISVFNEGLYHRSPVGAALTAMHLAIPTAFPELYRLDAEDRKLIASLWRICRRKQPKIAEAASMISSALMCYGYTTPGNARQAIDGSLSAVFRYLGKRYDPDEHMISRPAEIAWVDKMRDFAPGLSPRKKHEIIRDSIRSRREILGVHLRPDNIWVQFAPIERGFSAFNLPKITRPAPQYPGENTPFHPAYLPGPWPAMPEPLKMIMLSRLNAQPPEFDLYQPKYVLSHKPGQSQQHFLPQGRN